MVELWAGLMALSGLFEEHGAKVVAICEIVQTLRELGAAKYPQAVLLSDFYHFDWENIAHRLGAVGVDVLTGGPSCVTLSSAGKMLMQKDERSDQLLDSIKLAVYLGSRAILLENVANLLDLDEEHGLLSAADDEAGRAGYTRVAIRKLKHSECGGGSQRVRVFPTWVRDEVSNISPPVDDGLIQ